MWTTPSKELEGIEAEESFLDRPDLTKKQVEFLAMYTTCAFLPMKEVCRQAGVTTSQVAQWKLKSPDFRRQLEIEHRRTERVSGMNRKQVLAGIMDAIDLAKSLKQPAAMITGWKEVGRMCGFYEPERREILLTGDKKDFIREVKAMTTAQLLEHVRREVQDDDIDGEFEVIDAESPT
jgi:phage terminase small subunit